MGSSPRRCSPLTATHRHSSPLVDGHGVVLSRGQRDGQCVHTREHAHESRVKALAALPATGGASADGAARPHAFASASTDGTICVWRYAAQHRPILPRAASVSI